MNPSLCQGGAICVRVEIHYILEYSYLQCTLFADQLFDIDKNDIIIKAWVARQRIIRIKLSLKRS